MKKDTIFKESIKVEGNIKGVFNLKVEGNIDAENINVKDINAFDICAWGIDAGDIDAKNIICEKRIKKSKDAKTISCVYIKNKSKLERKEWED